MKDLRIVIVSWNVEALIESCLRSLPAACQGLDWECVVVDNDSRDQSVERIRACIAEFGSHRIKLIESGSNLGFAKACNLGSRDAQVRYHLYLNPDTECPALSLTKFVRHADHIPTAGIFGPKLLYPDGRVQESVRRFPGFWDQAGIILKLSHFFPKLNCFKTYFARDLDPELEQDVDQVMGACFLVRHELVEKKLGFDERYFIWLEEVDYCKTAIQAGWSVRYVPSVHIIHHQGKSFAQEFQPRKQAYFTTSLKKYFDKWHPGPQAWGIRLLAPIGQIAVWLVFSLQQTWGKWALLIGAVELISCLSIFSPIVMSFAAVILAGCMAFAAWKRPWIAVNALLLEIVIGSKGGILFVGEHPQTVSVRILLFIAFLFGWVLHVIASGHGLKRLHSWKTFLRGRWIYLILAGVIGMALVRGFWLGNGGAVWKDANAWGFWILLLPIVDIAAQHAERVEYHALRVLRVGVSWLAAKTLLVSYIFSHGLGVAPHVYPWIRRTGIGEITLITGNFFRVFFQSHVFAVFALIVLSMRQWAYGLRRHSWILAGVVSILLLGLSRSFWIGAISGLCCAAIVGWKFMRSTKQQSIHAMRGIAVSILLGLGLGLGSVMLPIPPVDIASLSSVFGKRADGGEAAVVSRWNLLNALKEKISQHPILGSGFGASVTYETKDPRIVKQSGGIYTTTAFEWGWLEHWVKFGLIGIPLMLGIICSLGWRIWKSSWDLWLRISGISVLCALATIHIFTPYLNHPLGIAVLIFGEAFVERGKRMLQ